MKKILCGSFINSLNRLTPSGILSKRMIFLAVMMLMVGLIWGQTITINQYGIQKNTVGGQSCEGGDLVKIRVDYSTSGDVDLVYGFNYSTTLNQVRIYWYDTSTPVVGTTSAISNSYVTVTELGNGDPGTNEIDYCTFTLPTPPLGAKSFGLRARLYGEDTDANQITSDRIYTTDYSTTFFSYMTLPVDSSTEAPTNVSWSQTSASEISVSYNLPEDGYSNSVRIYFSVDNTIGSDRTFLSIAGNDTYNSGNAHTVTLTYPFTTEDSDVSSLNETNSTLVHNTAYYVIVSYDDELQNGYATTASASTVTFDGQTDSFTSSPVLEISAYDLTIDYNLPENADNVWINFLYETSSRAIVTRARVKLKPDYHNQGNNSVTLAGDNFGNDSDADEVDLNYFNSLAYGVVYNVRVEYQDVYKNTAKLSSFSNNVTY
ncbi:MAG: hypothetical protein PHR06_00930, partial [Candidatus Cloacimonetes bacterium]|nr:hypothetical protein [Candidatus Cloacimonadota bacterium]